MTVEDAGRDISAHFWDTMVVRRVEALDKRVNKEVMQIMLLMLVEGMSSLTDNSGMILSRAGLEGTWAAVAAEGCGEGPNDDVMRVRPLAGGAT